MLFIIVHYVWKSFVFKQRSAGLRERGKLVWWRVEAFRLRHMSHWTKLKLCCCAAWWYVLSIQSMFVAQLVIKGLAIKYRKVIVLDAVTVRNRYEKMECNFPNYFSLAFSVFGTLYRVGWLYHNTDCLIRNAIIY